MRAASGSFGAYAVLWRGYDVLGVGKWFVYHLGDFAGVPRRRPGRGRADRALDTDAPGERITAGGRVRGAASPPPNVPGFSSSQRSRAARGASTGSTTVTGSTSSRCGSSASLSGSTSACRDPFSRPRSGSSAALALPLILPFGQLANEAGIDTVPGALWLRIEAELAGPGPASGQLALAIFVVGLDRRDIPPAAEDRPHRLAAGRGRDLRRHVVLRVGADGRGAARTRSSRAASNAPGSTSGSRRTPRCTKLYAETPCESALERHALYLTEFFNSTVDRAVLRHRLDPGRPSDRCRSTSHPRACSSTRGKPLVADYVFTQPGIELAGRRVAEGTAARLVLWHVGGPVQVIGAASDEQLRQKACP